MQNVILALAILLFTATSTYAQCDKKVSWVAEKQELIDSAGNIHEQRDGELDITTGKDSISIIPRNGRPPFIGVIKERTCEWKEKFKEGKSSYKIEVTTPNGQVMQCSVDIEATAGKILFYVRMPRLEGKRVRVTVTKYEEKE